MIIIIVLILVIAICTWRYYKTESYRVEEGCATIGVIASATLIFLLLIVTITQVMGRAEVQRYYGLRDSIERSRETDISEIERASIQNQIFDYNKDLASVKYYSGTSLKIFYYKGLAELEYLE